MKVINTSKKLIQRTKDRLPLISEDIIRRRIYRDGDKTFSTIEIKEEDLITKLNYKLGIC